MSRAVADRDDARSEGIVGMKVSGGYRAWVHGLADHVGLPVTCLLDQAVRDYAGRHGFNAPPPRVPRRGAAAG